MVETKHKRKLSLILGGSSFMGLSLLRNLADWGKERAIFLITHRLSTIQRADLILYLEGGRLRERGTHAELMGSPDSAYRALVENESLTSEPPEARDPAGENLS